MLLRLVSPVRRPGSSKVYFAKRLPADLAGRAVGLRLAIPLGDGTTLPYTIPKSGIRVSLRTADSVEAKARHGELAAFFERLFQTLRDSRPMVLTRRQAVGLSKRAYDAWAAGESRDLLAVEVYPDPSKPRGARVEKVSATSEEEEAGFVALAARLAQLQEDEEALSRLLGPIIRHQLVKEGIAEVTPDTWSLLLEAFRTAVMQGAEVRARQARGDYSSDPLANRFPDWVRPAQEPKAAPLSFEAMVAGWWAESRSLGISPSTHANYSGVFRLFGAFLEHTDALRVTAEDVIRFKDHRLSTPLERTGKPVSARTVKDHDLAALKSVFGWAVANRKVPTNPAATVTMKRPKAALSRSKGLTEEEAATVLRAAWALPTTSGEKPQTLAAKRWVPWLLAYTGARVGEMVQLRKGDLSREGDHWCLTIDPAAGRVKGGEFRKVPIHPHLVELGFVTFVERSAPGYLFVDHDGKTGSSLGRIDGVINRVREFVREHLKDPRVSPNHGWRHRFETLGRAHGMREDLQNMMTGHRGKTVAAREYGDPAGLYRQICLLPKIDLAGGA